ncbi:MAG: ribonuclease Z [Myxococcota bacterium]
MSIRELVVLGTASQVPTRHRNHNGYLLLWDGHGILFDPGEGTQRQMVFGGVSASQITRICVTHFHGDHCLGLAGIVQRISLDRVPQRIPVHFPASGAAYYQRLRHASIFVDLADLDPRPLDTPGLQDPGPPAITARPLRHSVESWGYRVEEPPVVRALPDKLAAAGIRGPDIGRLLRGGTLERDGITLRAEAFTERAPGGSVAFVMDTAPCDGALELAQGVDVLICESTYLNTEQREAHDRGHMTAADAGKLAQAAGVRRLVLTHFSQRYPSSDPFVAQAAEWYGGSVIAAEDGMRIGCRFTDAP